MTHSRLPRRLLLTLLLAAAAAGADDTRDDLGSDCQASGAEVPLSSALGSAGFMQNLAGHPDSISAVAARLLDEALSPATMNALAGCMPQCPHGTASEVVYRVAPLAFLPDTEQRAECVTFERETTATPLEFAPPPFASAGAVNEWIMEFSQGRGEDGRALYERCAFNCSPRYTFRIAERAEGFAVRAEVQCGLARDKADNQYRISTALRRTCAVN